MKTGVKKVKREYPERPESQKAACEMICEAVTRLDKQLNGNGQPGLRQDVQVLADEAHAFFVENRTQRKSEMEFHNQRDIEIKDALLSHEKVLEARDRKFKRLLAIAMLIIAVYMGWMAYRDSQRKISIVSQPIASYSNQPQNAVGLNPDQKRVY
jgi:hypothetical protein